MIHRLVSLFLAAFYLFVLPLLCGRLTDSRKHGPDGILIRYLEGMILMAASFQVAAVPLILLHRSLHLTLICWHLILALAAAAAQMLRERKLPAAAEAADTPEPFDMHEKRGGQPFSTANIVLFVIVLALFLVQCGFYIFGTHIDDDDARYAANAVEAYETDTLYRYHPNTGEKMDYFMGEISKEVVSPVTMYYAGISRLTGIHPTIMMHTVWPVVWLLLCYISYWLLSGLFMGDNRTKRLFFLMICMILMILGNTSARQGPVFVLTRLWQGKSLIPAIVMPLSLYLFLRGWKAGWRYYADLTGVALFACLSSGMGIVLTTAFTGLTVFAHACWEKKPAILFRGILCAFPNLTYAFIYILLMKVILR